MVPIWSVLLLGALWALPAVLVAGARRRTVRHPVRSASAAFVIVGAVLVVCLPMILSGWRNLASVWFFCVPVVVALFLRRRRGGSFLGAFLASETAAVSIVVWNTLYLKGPRGGWSATEVVAVLAGVTLSLTASACAGGWLLRRSLPATLAVAVAVVSLSCAAILSCDRPETGALEVSTDGPLRVEIRTEEGEWIVPDGAMPIVDDCRTVPYHNWVPWLASLQVANAAHGDLRNPYTGTTQFYVDGPARLELPPGEYRITAYRGIEHRVTRARVTVEKGKERSIDLTPSRWIDLPAEGWYASDDHLHIPRPTAAYDETIARWMQAEGIHVGNFLQMGLARDVHITPQGAFGEPSVYREGDTLLVSGQENPRTHVLGHSIVLGASGWVDHPAEYLLYDRFWEEARSLGGASGLAHLALGGAEESLAVWAHRGLLDFLEVMNLGFPYYERWYEALNLGIRIAATAGTDYPCLPSVPGRERFYTRIDGPLGLHAWLEGVRAGRTFVTNGPILTLEVEGRGPGEDLTLDAPGEIRVRVEVRVDPERDAVERLELVREGGVIAATGGSVLDVRVPVDRSTWIAARVRGRKIGETRIPSIEPLLRTLDVPPRATTAAVRRDLAEWGEEDFDRPSAAHTSPVWITVAGTPPVGEHEEADEVRRVWLGRLDELARRFDDSRIDELQGFPGRGDGVDRETLIRNRDALLRAIEIAREQHATRPRPPRSR